MDSRHVIAELLRYFAHDIGDAGGSPPHYCNALERFLGCKNFFRIITSDNFMSLRIKVIFWRKGGSLACAEFVLKIYIIDRILQNQWNG